MDVVEEIIGYMKTFKTDLGYFVDRENEIEKIINKIPYGRVSVIMGPRGCGKSTIAYTLVNALKKVSGYSGFYLAYREEEGISKSLLRVSNISIESLRELLRDRLEEIAGTLVKVSGLIDLMDLVIGLVKRRILREREIIVFIDEFHGEFNEVRQTLEVDANVVKWLHDMGYRVKTTYLTSDATASWLQLKLGSKIDWYLLWNLSRDSFMEIYSMVCRGHCIDYGLSWRLIGGNPRELYVLTIRYNWSLREYIGEKIAFIKRVVKGYMRESRARLEDVLSQLKAINASIDDSSIYPIYDYLIRNNVLMDVDMRFKRLSQLSREQWIGDEVAYQIPVYYWIVESMVKHHTLDIEAKHVIEEIE